MTEYKQHYNITEAAKLYGVSKSVVSRAVHRGDGTGLTIAKKDGQEILIGIDELMRFWGDPQEYKRKKQEKKAQANNSRSGKDGTQRLERSGTAEKQGSSTDLAQLALIQAKLKHAEERLEQEREERHREREMLREQYSQALEQAKSWQKQAESQTLLLTDEREQAKKSVWKFWKK